MQVDKKLRAKVSWINQALIKCTSWLEETSSPLLFQTCAFVLILATETSHLLPLLCASHFAPHQSPSTCFTTTSSFPLMSISFPFNIYTHCSPNLHHGNNYHALPALGKMFALNSPIDLLVTFLNYGCQ